MRKFEQIVDRLCELAKTAGALTAVPFGLCLVYAGAFLSVLTEAFKEGWSNE